MHLFRATVSVDTRRAINDHTRDSLKVIMGVQGELIVPLHL